MEQVRTPSSHCQLQILLPTESRGKYCQDYPPVTLSELRISLITKEFKDPINLILFALLPVWHWCSCESIGWKWGTPNCICIATRNQVHKCYDFLRQTAVSENLSRRPEINMACGSRASSEENKNDGIFFPLHPTQALKKGKKSKHSQMSLSCGFIHTPFSRSRTIQLLALCFMIDWTKQMFYYHPTQFYPQVCLYINKHTHTHTQRCFSQAR